MNNRNEQTLYEYCFFSDIIFSEKIVCISGTQIEKIVIYIRRYIN